MSSGKTVAIIGGGIAGLSAAVFLAERNFRVTIFESSPKPGGRAYSFYDREKEQFFDNGQHILVGWYKNTFDYLKITGSYSKLNFQKQLEINFISKEKKVYRLKFPDLKPPLNVLTGLLKFGALGLRDKKAVLNIRKLLNVNDLKGNFEDALQLLREIEQTDNLIKYFWEPFIFAVFNTVPEKVSAEIFLNVIRKGFNANENSVLVIPAVNLNELLINDALSYLGKNGAEIRLNTGVRQIGFREDLKKAEYVLFEDGNRISADYIISAVPFFAFRKLFDEKTYEHLGYKSDRIKSSCIVSVHLFFHDKINESMLADNSFGMTGLTGTNVQWIFRRNDRHLSLVISNADATGITDMSNEEIFNMCVTDLKSTLNEFTESMISDYKVLKEKRATFIPDRESAEYRPGQITDTANFFIAGDWTDTKLPSTIEGAVLSARICVNKIIETENLN